MIAADLLSKGIEHGIITAEQAARLRALEAAGEPADFRPSPDDEQLRFITGFSDIFVTIGIGMFLGAVGFFALRFGGYAAMGFGIAGIAWLLAEFFTRRRRMALPSIVLLAIFVASVFLGTRTLTDELFFHPLTWPYLASLPNPMMWLPGFGRSRTMPVIVAALLSVAAASLHYWRFRVPITIAAGCAALTIAIFSSVFAYAPSMSLNAYSALIFACGAAIFALAMRFDMSDLDRKTRRTDIAFWLHLLAAPLIVHSILYRFKVDALSLESAIAIVAVFVLLSIVALLIDRRAVLVSGLIYAGYALATLVREAGLVDYTGPVTLLALGSFVLLLSAGWAPLRTAIMRQMPDALTLRLPRSATT